MAILKAINSKAKYIKSVVNYVKKDAKTANGYYVEGINCDPRKATSEFIKIQELWGKTDGRRYFHYVMSWAAVETITPEKALEIGKEWLIENTKLEGHQILLAAHLDQKHGNIHIHIVGNSVNMLTGKKLSTSAKDLADWKKLCNKINLQHGFQPPRKKTTEEKKRNPSTWTKEEYQAHERANKEQKKGMKAFILESVIAAYTMATSKLEFISQLSEKGITTIWKDTKKNITFTADEKVEADTSKRTIRDSNIEKTFGFKCDKETLETKFQTNLEQQQAKEKEELDGQREREAAELLRIAAEFERRKSNTRRREQRPEESSTEERTRDTAAFIDELTAREQSAAADRADRNATRERQAAEAERHRTEAAAERERLLEKQRKETAERIAAAERRAAEQSNNNSTTKKKGR